MAVHSARKDFASTSTPSDNRAKPSSEECPEDTHPAARGDTTPTACSACGAQFDSGVGCACSTFGSSPRTVERNVMSMAAAAGLGAVKSTASADDGPFA